MKLLLFSDNHRDRDSVKEVIRMHPDMDRYISLGDSEMKEHELSSLNVFGVKGNYPFEPNFPYDLSFNFLGLSVFFTHGHRYSVKLGLTKLLNHAIYNNIDIVCFGHTHRPFLREIEKVLFINPGCFSKERNGASNSYCILEITETLVHVVINTLSGVTLMDYDKER
ncbi:MAG: YfcE family phosphodiesterase [Tenericutes bacterium]|nr:YfcE family phosphodiesterase [Mycoplasmatota bacterium]